MGNAAQSNFMGPFGGPNPGSDSKNAKFATMQHNNDNENQLASLSSSLGHQNMYSQATRQNIKSIIQSLNNPLGQAAQPEQVHAPKRPHTQLGQAQQSPFPGTVGQLTERTPADRRESPASPSYDQ
jgi:hypothetical protein